MYTFGISSFYVQTVQLVTNRTDVNVFNRKYLFILLKKNVLLIMINK